MSSPCRFPKMGVPPNHPFKNIDSFLECSMINYPFYRGFGVPPWKPPLMEADLPELRSCGSPCEQPSGDPRGWIALAGSSTHGGLVKPHKNIHLHGVLRPGCARLGWDLWKWAISRLWHREVGDFFWKSNDSNLTTRVYGTLNYSYWGLKTNL